MVNSPTDADPHQQQPIFSKGTSVEVSSDEEGFRGAWYLATIQEIPPKSASKKRKKLLVRYHSLVADDGRSLLTEYVDPAYIRPLPPKDKGNVHSGFQVNDVVDANYRDGWWVGVVRKVLEKNRYRVKFDNPPDVIDFDRKDLRVHWDWIGSRWIRPEKQQSTGSVFSPGTAVEINIDNENLRDVWFPAVVVRENEDNTFLVKYQHLRNDDDEFGTIKVVVDSLHIRPTPPRYADRNYELLERVDATNNFGWRTGVITKVLPGRRYTVFFKHGNEDKELCHSHMRPNVEWIDGKWISKSKEVIIAADEQEQIGDALCGTHNTKVSVELESSVSTKDTQDKTHLTKMNKKFAEQPTPTVENSNLHPSKKVKLETSNGTTSRSRSSKKLPEGNAVKTPLSVTGDQLKDMPIETLCKKGTRSTGGKGNAVTTPLSVTGDQLKAMPIETSGIKGTPSTGGKGARVPREIVIGDLPCAKSESPLTGGTTTTKRKKAGSSDSTPNNLVKRNVRPRKSPRKGPQVSATGKEGTTRIAEEINEGEIKTKEVEMPIILGLAAKFTKTLEAEDSFQSPSEEPLKMGDQKNNLNDSVRNENTEIKEDTIGVSDPKKRKGGTRRSAVSRPKASVSGKAQNGDGGITDEKAVNDCTSDDADLSKHKGVELSASEDFGRRAGDDYKSKEVHLETAGISDMDEMDQPLSTWIGGIHTSSDEGSRLPSGRLVNGWNGEIGLVDVPIESFAMDASGRSPLDNDQSLPFVKKSPVWRTIESMDVFQVVPQKPHFQPLAENREEFREGSAIGIMVTFAGLFEKISMLHFDEPRNTFDSILESLGDLEKHGFDVTLLRSRLNKLLAIKEEHNEQVGEIEKAEREMTENTKEMTKLDEEMEKIEKEITRLQGQYSSLKSLKGGKDLKVDSLKLHIKALNNIIEHASHQFKRIATASWKLP